MAGATLMVLMAASACIYAYELPQGVYQLQFQHTTASRPHIAAPLIELELLSAASNFDNLVDDGVIAIKQNGETVAFNPRLHDPVALVKAKTPQTSIVIRPERAHGHDLTFLQDDQVAKELSSQFSNVPISMHVYISGPGKARALKPHTDGGDVFVHQLSGRKEWTVCTPACPAGYNCDGLSQADQALMADVATKHFNGRL